MSNAKRPQPAESQYADPANEYRGLEQHYRAKDLALRLNISPSLAKQLLASRRIDTVRLGTAVLAPESAVVRYLERNRHPAIDDGGARK